MCVWPVAVRFHFPLDPSQHPLSRSLALPCILQLARMDEAKRLGQTHFYVMEVTSAVYIDARTKVRTRNAGQRDATPCGLDAAPKPAPCAEQLLPHDQPLV